MPLPPEGRGEFLVYQTEDGRTRVACRFAEGTVWLAQAAMAKLFQTTPQNITLHIAAIYEEQELQESATCKEYLQVRQEGSRQVCLPAAPFSANGPPLASRSIWSKASSWMTSA